MVKIFIVFLVVIFAIGILVTAAISIRNRGRIDDIDRHYYDEDGNHMYYDRSIIEKKEFNRQNPSESKHVRTFSRLFRHKD